LILDEATSSLDESEKLVQERLKFWWKEEPSIIIAHRLSTILLQIKFTVLDKEKLQNKEHIINSFRNGIYKNLSNLRFNS
jgi:ABC-type bacteriocin/lantibiotic exporter with double-glycine peptidase domain